MKILSIVLLLLIFIGLIIGLIYYMINVPGKSYQGPLLPLSKEEIELEFYLKQHVTHLSEVIEPRNIQNIEALNVTASYIKNYLTQNNYIVTLQRFDVNGKIVANVIAEKTGTKLRDEIIIIGAHYDAIEPDCPGANDNGSGVAANLEIARLLKDTNTDRTLRFVFFANEEPPHFKTQHMGSLHYAKYVHFKNENIVAMLCLETLGFYSDQKGSQSYPFPFNLLYPNTGNFIAFVGNINSKPLVHQSIKTFRETTQFPSEGGAFWSAIPGVDWSDQWAFWNQGYPAIMITDTAPYRYPHYHLPTDTADKLVYARFARVVVGIKEVILDLVSKK